MRAAAADGTVRCEHCAEPIMWVYPTPVDRPTRPADPAAPPPRTRRADDKPLPMNATPDPAGLFTVRHDKATDRMLYAKLRPAQVPGFRAGGGVTYERHWATCPKKYDWGKPGSSYSSRNVAR